MFQAEKRARIQAFVPEFLLEALDTGVLHVLPAGKTRVIPFYEKNKAFVSENDHRMVKLMELGATFPRPGDAGHGVHQFFLLKTTQLSRPFGMDLTKKPAKKP